MPIALREDVMYILLKKIKESDRGQGKHEVSFNPADFTGRQLTSSDLLGHLDYLNQRQYIEAEFEGNAYATLGENAQKKAEEVSHLIRFKKAKLTEKGEKMLQKMEEDQPEALSKGPSSPIASKDMPFLEKVAIKGELEDIFDARDVTEVVFRTMRDMMSTEAAERVTEELHEPAEPSKDKALQNEIADLWKDTNPIVSFLSRVRPPLKIDSDTFLFRIRQEGGLPRYVNPEITIKAVFSATKEELSEKRVAEIAEVLPDKIRQIWEKA